MIKTVRVDYEEEASQFKLTKNGKTLLGRVFKGCGEGSVSKADFVKLVKNVGIRANERTLFDYALQDKTYGHIGQVEVHKMRHRTLTKEEEKILMGYYLHIVELPENINDDMMIEYCEAKFKETITRKHLSRLGKKIDLVHRYFGGEPMRKGVSQNDLETAPIKWWELIRQQNLIPTRYITVYSIDVTNTNKFGGKKKGVMAPRGQ